MRIEKTKRLLFESIKELNKIFQSNQYYFLNEHDVLAFLYSDLIKRFHENKLDFHKTTPIHCKIGAYKNRGEYDFQPDLSIFNLTKSSDFQTDYKIEGKRKDFWFKKRIIGMEIKYCLNCTESNIKKKIESDYNKLKSKKEYDGVILFLDNKSRLDKNYFKRFQEKDTDLNIDVVYLSPNHSLYIKKGKIKLFC